MSRLRRFGRLFVSLRVQKTSGAENPPRRLRAVPNRRQRRSQGKHACCRTIHRPCRRRM